MPTWCRCSPPILFWHWPPFDLFPSSGITDLFRRFLLMGTTLRAAPNIYMPFRQISMYIYCNAHMIYMYTYFVLTSINSCFVHVQQHAPPRIAGAGHPCSDRSLFFKCLTMAAVGHFGCPKFTFDRISGHFRSIRNFFYLFGKMATGVLGSDVLG